MNLSSHLANFDIVYYDFAGQARTEISWITRSKYAKWEEIFIPDYVTWSAPLWPQDWLTPPLACVGPRREREGGSMAGSSAAAAVVGMEESDSTCQLLILGTPPSDRERQTVKGGRSDRRAELLSSIFLFCQKWRANKILIRLYDLVCYSSSQV